MAIDSEARTSRRGLLAAALGGLGGLVVAKLGRPDSVAAADGGNALLGTANTSTTETSFENTDAGDTSLGAIHTDGTAIRGDVTGGTAILAGANGSGTGVSASSTSGTGVNAVSGSGFAVSAGSNTSSGVWGSSNDDTPSTFAAGSYRSGVVGSAGDQGIPGQAGGISSNTDEVGVYGFSDISSASTGVWGDSWQGVGVLGTGDYGLEGSGRYGVVAYGDVAALYGAANSPAAYALYTSGKIRFANRSGKTAITSGHVYKDVAISGMTTSSVVIASLVTHRTGYTVESVVSYAGKFRLYLNKTATSTIYFSFLVIG
jgi:hypothetical protein